MSVWLAAWALGATPLTVSSREDLELLQLRFGDVVVLTQTLTLDSDFTFEVDPALQVQLIAPPAAPAFQVEDGRTALSGFRAQVDEGGFAVLKGGTLTLRDVQVAGRPAAVAAISMDRGDLVVWDSSLEGVGGPMGAVLVTGGSVAIADTRFAGNGQGALRVDGADDCLVERSTFESNLAMEGGAVRAEVSCTIRWSDFLLNQADAGGALFLVGGGEVVGGRFCGNSAATSGGAGLLQGVDLSASVFHGNHALAHGVLSGEGTVRQITTARNTSLELGLFGLAVSEGLHAEPLESFGPQVQGWLLERDGPVELAAFDQLDCPPWAAWVPEDPPDLGGAYAGALDACAESVWVDADHDGAGGAWRRMDCSWSSGEAHRGGDCDDADPGIHPGAVDLPGDGIDQDCTGFDSCFADADGDGLPSLDPVDGALAACFDGVVELEDCDDLDQGVHPLAEEVPCDGIDQDCDGLDPCEPATTDGTDGPPATDPEPVDVAEPLGLPLCRTAPGSVGLLAGLGPALWLRRRPRRKPAQPAG